MVLARLSNELNTDAAISFGDKLVGEIAYAFANKEDECVFNGTGTSTYGHITGIRTRLDELTAGTAPGLTLGAGNAYSELTLANFQSVVGSLPQYADRPGAGWVCHKTFAHTVMQRLALAAGGSTATEIINGMPTLMFLGYPVTISQVFPSVEANSQIPVIFGDLSLGAMFGNRGQETIAFSTEATVGGESMWERDQIGVRGTERFDAVVHDYGSNSVAGPIVGLEMAGS
jgi:HK97 family phage major capsid protein